MQTVIKPIVHEKKHPVEAFTTDSSFREMVRALCGSEEK
jgi:hypothetical protein